MKVNGDALRVLKLYSIQNGRCPYTDLPLLPFVQQGIVNEDHIIPKAKGGSDDLSNIALVPEWVNQMKKDMTKDEFMQWLRDNALPCKV